MPFFADTVIDLAFPESERDFENIRQPAQPPARRLAPESPPRVPEPAEQDRRRPGDDPLPAPNVSVPQFVASENSGGGYDLLGEAIVRPPAISLLGDPVRQPRR
jgi:hypothetical protein